MNLRLLCHACLLALCTGPALAQTDAHKGRIIGVVLDALGASVADARVSVVNDATAVTRALRSNRSGEYQASSLDPGSYTVRAGLEGFADASVERVLVSVGTTVRADVTLQIEESRSEIDVSASLIDPAQSTSDNIVDATAIRDLPINGRRFQDFALLTPTVLVDRQRGQLSFVGQRGINSNVMVDGTDYNQPFFGGIRGGERSNSIITVPQSAIREFQAVAAGYTAEYGRSSGGLLNVITKGGTNELRGDAFHQVRDSRLGAEDPFGAKVLETLPAIRRLAGWPARPEPSVLLRRLRATGGRHAETGGLPPPGGGIPGVRAGSLRSLQEPGGTIPIHQRRLGPHTAFGHPPARHADPDIPVQRLAGHGTEHVDDRESPPVPDEPRLEQQRYGEGCDPLLHRSG